MTQAMRIGRQAAVLFFFSLLVLTLGIRSNTVGADEKVARQSPTVVIPSLNLQFSSDGTTFSDNLSVNQGDTVWVRLNYDNTGDEQGTGVAAALTLPAGFTLVGGSTTTCLTPSGAETLCNTDAGMGGAITEGTVWTGQVLGIAPQAGLYAEAVDATSGILEFGKLRYVNLQECRSELAGTDLFYATLFNTGTNASNTANGVATCTGSPPYTHTSNQVLNLDLLGKKYLNLQDCQYIFGADRIGVNTANTATSNTAGALNCPPNAGAHIFEAGDFAALDLVGNPYLNLKECLLFNFATDNVSFNLRAGATTNTGLAADTVNNCTNAGAPGYSVLQNRQLPLDLRDSTRGAGYIEFQVTADATAGSPYAISSTLNGNEFAEQTDSGNVTVTAAAAVCNATIDGATVYSSADSQAVRDAVAAASNNDLVKIAGTCAGVDSGNLVAISGITLTLQGGYTTSDWNTSNPAVNPTILDGVNAGRIIDTDSSLTIKDLTLQNGQATAGNGGAVNADQAGTLLTIENSQFISNTADIEGGALNIDGSTVTIVGGEMAYNRAMGASGTTDGGGIHLVSGTLNIDGTAFHHNYSNGSGGAIGNGDGAGTGGTVTVTNATFYTNTTQANGSVGGAIRSYAGTITIAGSTFSDHTGAGLGSGGAVYLNAGNLTVTNSNFTSNTVSIKGGAIYSTDSLNISGSTFDGNRSTTMSAGNGAGTIFTAGDMVMDTTEVLNGYAFDFTIQVMGVATVTNSLFANNAVKDDQSALYAGSGYIASTIFRDNLNETGSGTTSDNVVGFFVGSAVLTDVQFLRNTMQNGSAPLFLQAGGTVNNSSFISNTVSINGGALYASGVVTVTTSTFISNTAGASGGAIINQGDLTVTSSTFEGNEAVNQGGALLVNTGATAIIDSSSFINNSITSTDELAGGGAIFNKGTTDVTNSTFSGNDSASDSGAIETETGALHLLNTTIANNTAADNGGGIGIASGSVYITNTIVASNTGPNGIDVAGSFTSAINNLLSNAEGGIVDGVNGNIVSASPGLGVLTSAGNGTQVIPLLNSSPAIGTGDNASAPATDQRGVARPQGAAADIGAYEFDADTTPPAAPVVTAPISGTTTIDLMPPFTGTGEPGATIEVRDGSGALVCTAVVDSNGDWSCTPASPLPYGMSEFTVTATDPAGNTSDPIGVNLTVNYGYFIPIWQNE